MTATLERRRTGWDVVFGIALILGGFVVLGNAVLATAMSVFVIGWTALVSGLVLVVASLFRIKSGGFWSAALGGAILAVLGLFVLRNPLAGAVTLTLLAGGLFFASGFTRIVAGFQAGELRWLLIVGGVISVCLGIYVLTNVAAATFTLLGILLGIQVLIEGTTLLVAGRLRPVTL